MPASRGRGPRRPVPEPPDAFETAVRLLTQRPHGEEELRRKMARRGCPAEDVDGALERVRRLGYLDDAAFARMLAANRSRTRGPAAIAAELAARGVDRRLAREAAAEIGTDAMLRAAARVVARAPDADRRVLAGRLVQRGFPTAIIRQVLASHPPCGGGGPDGGRWGGAGGPA